MRYGLLMKAEDDELLILDEPVNYIELISDIESMKWLETMKSQIDSMYTNQVWTLDDPLKGIKLIGSLKERLTCKVMYICTKLD
jgi:ABC-type Mn2+/Zn2+ transport system ATPase subunit